MTNCMQLGLRIKYRLINLAITNRLRVSYASYRNDSLQRSLKVIGNVTVRQSTHGLLLLLYSSYGPILYLFPHTATSGTGRKSQNLYTPNSRRRDPVGILNRCLRLGLQYEEESMTIVLNHCNTIPESDRWTELLYKYQKGWHFLSFSLQHS